MRHYILTASAVLALGAFSVAPALAANPTNANGSAASANSASTADSLLNGATKTIDNLKQDQAYAAVLRQAKGVFIIPSETTGALGVGGTGGQGILLRRTSSGWSQPAFMTLGALSLGPQAGGGNGETVMLLMTSKAMNDFVQANNLSFGANAGLRVAGYTGNNQPPKVGDNDVIIWSNRKSGAYAGAKVSATHIAANTNEDQNFYNKKVDTQQILNGDVSPQPAARSLVNALPA